jgi:hypothetical protein
MVAGACDVTRDPSAFSDGQHFLTFFPVAGFQKSAVVSIQRLGLEVLHEESNQRNLHTKPL